VTRRAATGLLLALVAAPAAAQTGFGGTWRGTYVCAQGNTALALTIAPRKDGTVSALFHFAAAPDNPDVRTGCFEMQGRAGDTPGEIALRPVRWLRRPANYLMVGLDGAISADGGRIEGLVRGPGCTVFRVERIPGPPDGEACRAGAPLLSLR
jgi:hypothetical protein